MDTKVLLCKITCPDCGTEYFEFVGNDEDSDFCCNAEITVRRGKKESTEKCDYCGNLHHMPEGSVQYIYSITYDAIKGLIII